MERVIHSIAGLPTVQELPDGDYGSPVGDVVTLLNKWFIDARQQKPVTGERKLVGDVISKLCEFVDSHPQERKSQLFGDRWIGQDTIYTEACRLVRLAKEGSKDV